MNTEIICFASGRTNENLSDCEKQLCALISQLNLTAPERTQCSAEEKQLTAAFKDAVANNQVIFLCGDIEISKALICRVYRLNSNPSEEYKNLLLRRCAKSDENAVLFPAGSQVAFCRETTDSAFSLSISGKTIFALPSNPISLKTIIEDCVIPYFAKEKNIHLSRTKLKLFGITESELLSVIKVIKNKYPIKTITYFSHGKVSLEISACSKSGEEADSVCYAAIGELKTCFGDSIYEVGHRSLAEITVNNLKKTGLKISTAESCTGGMLSEAITSVSGSSNVLEMGICAYSNRIKKDTIGVSENILDSFGAISKETAVALAKGIRKASSSDLGIGITGVAGPEKSEGKAVGTVYIALSDGKNYWIRLLTLPETHSRDEIRGCATATALDLLRRYLICLPAVLPGACTEESLTVMVSQPTINLTGSFVDRQIEPAQILPEQSHSAQQTEIGIPETAGDTVPVDLRSHIQFDTDQLYTETSELAGFIQDNFGEENNSDDDSPELAAENYNDDIGIIIDDDYEALPAKEKKNIKPKLKASKGITIAFTAAIALLLVAAIFFGNYFFKIYRDLSQIDSAREIYASLSKNDAFSKLDGENDEFTGWLSISDTDINNPVYQTDNNSFYAAHNMNKQKSRYGALFFDFRNIVEGDEKSKNIVIYGQNMNDGAMFGALNNYQDLSFLTAHSEITLSTAQSDDTYKVYAVIITNADKEDDDGNLFDFTRSNFDNTNDFTSWANELKAKNLYITDLQISFSDSFLTLVTTSQSFDNARLVVIAKKTTSGDRNATYAVNPSPVYPKAWYEERNLEPNLSSITTGNDAVSDTSSEESSSEQSSSEESSSTTPSSRPSTPAPSRPNPSTPVPSTPSSSVPSVSEPESSTPESSDPENSEPENSQPENSEPESSAPENSQPQINESENTTTE